MNESPGAHAHVALTGLTLAKYFCNDSRGRRGCVTLHQQDSLIHAGSEVMLYSLCCHQPSLFTDMAHMNVM